MQMLVKCRICSFLQLPFGIPGFPNTIDIGTTLPDGSSVMMGFGIATMFKGIMRQVRRWQSFTSSMIVTKREPCVGTGRHGQRSSDRTSYGGRWASGAISVVCKFPANIIDPKSRATGGPLRRVRAHLPPLYLASNLIEQSPETYPSPLHSLLLPFSPLRIRASTLPKSSRCIVVFAFLAVITANPKCQCLPASNFPVTLFLHAASSLWG